MVSLQEILKTQTETVLEEAENQKMLTKKYDKARSEYFWAKLHKIQTPKKSYSQSVRLKGHFTESFHGLEQNSNK